MQALIRDKQRDQRQDKMETDRPGRVLGMSYVMVQYCMREGGQHSEEAMVTNRYPLDNISNILIHDEVRAG